MASKGKVTKKKKVETEINQVKLDVLFINEQMNLFLLIIIYRK